MEQNSCVTGLRNIKSFFDKSTSALVEADSGFAPHPDMYSAAQQVAHAAHTVDWFVDAAFGGKGFDMDFEAQDKKVRAVNSLKEAHAWMDRAIERAVKEFGSRSTEQLMQPLPPGIMGGAPILACIQGIADHTAHHRGALAVYTRLVGKVPPMPYM